ncbi:MAG TPA: SMP-30/gluconolactonase/LRE family protein [Casimicrobiaceae bacterium]|nr:SMP-30/gluconolactonase/LRE family protein [Casimicrobiaceae bacterium]
MGLDAALLRPNDDVATALRDLARGERLRLTCGEVVREVDLVEDVALGHKFAVRDLGEGMRVRKYGEYIGRLTANVRAGAWVHDHNLATSATRHADHEHAWSAPASVPVRVIGTPRTSVGETPVYDATTHRLYWIDVRDTPAIHSLDLDSGAEQHWPLDEDIGSIALTSRSTLIAGLRSGFAFFDPARGRLQPIADPEPHLPGNRMNDGKCDPAGRFWCCSMNPESGTADGALYVLERDLTYARVGDERYFTPNGLAWSPDGETMYFADTRRGVLYAYDFDPRMGSACNRRMFADLGAFPGGPDGATVDVDGFVWSAQFDGSCIIRYDPNGRMDRVIRLPVSKPTACVFGGRDHRELFVTTATRGLDARQRAAEPDAGRVLVLDVGVAGLPAARFHVDTGAQRRTA